MSARSKTQRSADPQIAVTMTQGPHPAIEQNLRNVFAAAIAIAPSDEPSLIASEANRHLERGCFATLEAERGPWSRYRVAMRVQGMPVTIATVEVTVGEEEPRT
ncbi:MAG: hypothetical protein JOZ51_21255 [Chloroflexi bacterium]|nr:hypothetical protein [Chloroflexota bacterium]